MASNQDLLLNILISTLLLIVGALISRYFESRAKLLAYYGHTAAGKIKDPETNTYIPVYSHSVIIRNFGQKTANNLKIGHHPLSNINISDIVNIYPTTDYSIVGQAEEGQEIIISKLVPKEQITLTYIYFPPLTFDKITAQIKSDEGLAEVAPVLLQKQYPIWLNVMSYFLLLIGFVTVAFSVYKLMVFSLNIILHCP